MDIDRYQIIQHCDHPTTPIFTEVLAAIFGYCSYTWDVQIIIGVFPFCYCGLFRVNRFHFLGGGQSIFSVTTVMLKDQEIVDQESI